MKGTLGSQRAYVASGMAVALLSYAPHLGADVPSIDATIGYATRVALNADPAGSAIVGEAGTQWAGYQSRHYPATLDAAKFESYLKEEGLERVIAERKKRGQSGAPGRERFYRCAKSLLEVSGTSSIGFARR